PPPSTLFPYTTLFRSSRAPISPAGTAHNAIDEMSSGSPPRSAHRLRASHTPTMTPSAMHNPYIVNGPILLKPGLGSDASAVVSRSEEHTSELQSRSDI